MSTFLDDSSDPATEALDAFVQSVRKSYGPRLKHLILFGSRARGEAREDSDFDVAVVLDEMSDRATERNHLSDLAYDIIVETSLEIQPWPISEFEWLEPERHSNPSLVRSILRDGTSLERHLDRKDLEQGAAFR